ncbi:MAG: histidinol-phosphatase HisJ family protein [Nanoarchaeota archaeon]|nr:histidinol-phosphatase HisJ family protein [Nanoarchaeota archaeon]
MFDNHVHTNLTEDSNATLEEYAERAVDIGLSAFTITNHCSLGRLKEDGWKVVARDFKKLERDARIFSDKFGIDIKIGVELDYFEDRKTQFKDVLDWFDFDIVLVSCHYLPPDFKVNCADRSSASFFEACTDIDHAYRRYYDNVRGCIDFLAQTRGDFVLAHLDLIKKYSAKFFEVPSVKDPFYFKLASGVVADLVHDNAKNIAAELNTRGFEHASKEPYPSKGILELLFTQGYKRITIGSDGHTVEGLGKYIPEGLSLLKEIGFKGVYDYEKCKPYFVSFSEPRFT